MGVGGTHLRVVAGWGALHTCLPIPALADEEAGLPPSGPRSPCPPSFQDETELLPRMGLNSFPLSVPSGEMSVRGKSKDLTRSICPFILQSCVRVGREKVKKTLWGCFPILGDLGAESEA